MSINPESCKDFCQPTSHCILKTQTAPALPAMLFDGHSFPDFMKLCHVKVRNSNACRQRVLKPSDHISPGAHND